MTKDALLIRLVMICVMGLTVFSSNAAVSQDSDIPPADDKKKTEQNLRAIDEVFFMMLKNGYLRAEYFVSERIREFEDARKKQITELKTELINTDQSETGKGRPFKTSREKAVRKEELRLRIAKLESMKPNTATVKWLQVEQELNPIEHSSEVRPGVVYSIASLEVSQITGPDEFHGYVRILPPNPKPAAEVAWMNPKSESAKRWLQSQRCVVWYPDGTATLKEGKDILTKRQFFICTDTLTYETASGSKTIPIIASLDKKWEKFVKANVPVDSMRIVTPTQSPTESMPLREWKDTTGKFSVEARLVSANDTNVELKKTDGTTITVRKSIMCIQDNIYIEAARLAEVPFVSRFNKQDESDF